MVNDLPVVVEPSRIYRVGDADFGPTYVPSKPPFTFTLARTYYRIQTPVCEVTADTDVRYISPPQIHNVHGFLS
jgi:hypothetical protein